MTNMCSMQAAKVDRTIVHERAYQIMLNAHVSKGRKLDEVRVSHAKKQAKAKLTKLSKWSTCGAGAMDYDTPSLQVQCLFPTLF